jgi:hypothetical protein
MSSLRDFSLLAKEREEIRWGRFTQGSSFLATAGLICETRFGVFKMVRRGREWWAKVEGVVKEKAKG